MRINYKNIVLFETSDPFRDAYAYFGVKAGAPKEEIRKVYREKARELHPDVSPRDRSEFQKAAEHYATLTKDLEKKKAYDKGGLSAVKAFDRAEDPQAKAMVSIFPDMMDPFKAAKFAKDTFADPFTSAGKKLFSRTHDRFKFDPNSTENEGRWRLKDPKFFSRYFRLKSKTPGVSYVMGKNSKTKKVEVQAIRFDKRKINEKQATRWWEKNKHRFRKEWTW